MREQVQGSQLDLWLPEEQLEVRLVPLAVVPGLPQLGVLKSTQETCSVAVTLLRLKPSPPWSEISLLGLQAALPLHSQPEVGLLCPSSFRQEMLSIPFVNLQPIRSTLAMKVPH